MGEGRGQAERTATPRGAEPAVRDVIVDAAIAAMFEHGYHGTSVRQIADRAGMSVANVYYYFPSKHDLLFRFMEDSAIGLLAQLDDMLQHTPADPRLRLSGAVRLFVVRHTARQAAAFVAATELRALEPAAREVIVARRNAIEAVFRQIVAEGVEVGVFRTDDPNLAVRAILDMSSSVSAWYRSGGSLSGDEIAERYVGLALAMAGAVEGRARSAARRKPSG